MIHDMMTLMVAGLCFWAIIDHRVPTGVLASAGLGAVMIAAIWSVDDAHDQGIVLDILLGGIGAIAIGVLWRIYVVRNLPVMRGEDRRRDTDERST